MPYPTPIRPHADTMAFWLRLRRAVISVIFRSNLSAISCAAIAQNCAVTPDSRDLRPDPLFSVSPGLSVDE
jgi:hypothetical protein